LSMQEHILAILIMSMVGDKESCSENRKNSLPIYFSFLCVHVLYCRLPVFSICFLFLTVTNRLKQPQLPPEPSQTLVNSFNLWATSPTDLTCQSNQVFRWICHSRATTPTRGQEEEEIVFSVCACYIVGCLNKHRRLISHHALLNLVSL
jgi:hypothetical protein